MGWAYYKMEKFSDACLNWNKAKEMGYKFSKGFIKKKCEIVNSKKK